MSNISRDYLEGDIDGHGYLTGQRIFLISLKQPYKPSPAIIQTMQNLKKRTLLYKHPKRHRHFIAPNRHLLPALILIESWKSKYVNNKPKTKFKFIPLQKISATLYNAWKEGNSMDVIEEID